MAERKGTQRILEVKYLKITLDEELTSCIHESTEEIQWKHLWTFETRQLSMEFSEKIKKEETVDIFLHVLQILKDYG